MPVYPVIHLETGETKELTMTVADYEQWRKENSEWDKNWQAGVASIGEVGEWRDKLVQKHPGWNEILDKASKVPRSQVKKI